MIGDWELVTAPAEDPVTLAEAKAHLRVDLTDDDSLITALITAATGRVEDLTRSALITQTWRLWLDDWPAADRIRLPKPPVQSVTNVKYYGTDDSESTFAASNYFLNQFRWPAELILKDGSSWPSDNLRPSKAVAVEFVAGYGLAAAVPEKIKLAIKLIVGHYYENREDVIIAQGVAIQAVPDGARALLGNVKHFTFGV